MGSSVIPQTNPTDAIWSGGSVGPNVSANPTDAIWNTSPNAEKAAHITRIKGALANKEVAEAEQESPMETGVRDFASGVSGTVGQFASGAGKLLHITPLSDVGSRLTRASAEVAPTDENAGRNPIASNVGGDIGEAAPQFLAGEVAGIGARPVTRLIGSKVAALAPQVGPAVAEGTTKLGEAFKAGARALPGTAAANTALQAVADPEHPVTPVSAGMSALGALGEAGETAGRVGANPRIRGAPTYQPLSATDLAAVKSALEAPDAPARARILSRTPLGGESTVTGDITRRPMNTAATTETADEIAAQLKSDEAQRAFAEPVREPFSTPSTETVRRPASVGIDAEKLAKPLPEGAPISTADTRLAVDQAQKVIEANMVTPNPNPAPAADEALPEGYSTKATTTTRRAAPDVAAPPAVTTEEASAAARRAFAPVVQAPDLAPPAEAPPSGVTAPQQGPLLTRDQVESQEAGRTPETPESAGRDLAAPGRVPANVPRETLPRGIEPKGSVSTDDGAVSVARAPSPKEIATRAAAKVFAPDSPDLAAFAKHMDEAFPEEGRPASRAISGDEPAVRTTKGTLAKNLSTIGDRTLAAEYARLHQEHADTEAWIHDKTEQNWPGRDDGMDADEGWKQNNTDVQALKKEVAEAQKRSGPRQAELTRLEAELQRRNIDPTEALRSGSESAYPDDWDAEPSAEHQPAPEVQPEGEGKNVPAAKLLNTDKLGLKSSEQDATVRADLERLKAAGTDRERVGLDAQTEAAKQNIQNSLKFMLTDLDPDKAAKLSGAEIGQLYEHLSNNAAQRTALLKEAGDPATSPERVAKINELIDGLQKDADAMAGNIVKGTAQKGRDLNYLRQVAQQSTDPAVWLAQAKRALGDRPLDDETQSLIVKLAQDAKEACA